MSTNKPTDPSEVLDGASALVVEDFSDHRAPYAMLLVASGAEVTAVGSIAEALEALGRARFDVLVTDIELADGSGLDLVARLRTMPAAQGGAMPAVAVTNPGKAPERARLWAAGFQDHVTRPVDAAELVRVVARLLGRANWFGI